MKLEVNGLVKRFDRTAALDGVDLHVPDSGVLVLIGPSGGGKSTLLRVLGGLEEPDEGTVIINDTPLPRDPAGSLAWRRSNGFLFQQFNLFPHLTALRNITLPLEIVHGKTAADALALAQSCLDRFQLLDHAHKLPGQLSGGQQQRVGLARAIATQPGLLLLDEPTSALDPEMTAEVLELIQELAEAGQNIILSTHEMGFARAVAHQIAFIAAGKAADFGPPARIFSPDAAPVCRKFLSRVMRY